MAKSLVVVSQNLDISHPAGSPTYSLSSNLFTLLPVGNIALRVNFFSSICSSICVSLIFILIFQIGHLCSIWIKYIASIIGSLSLFASKSFHHFSEVAEVYSFQNLSLILLIMILIISQSSRLDFRARYDYCFAFLYGISIGIHASMIIFSPAFILYLFMRDRWRFRIKQVCFSLFFSMLGFAIYIYLPLRSISVLPFDWGNPETLYQFFSQIFDKKGNSQENFYLLDITAFKFKLYVEHITNEFSAFFVFVGAVGLIGLFMCQLNLSILLCTIFISNIVFFLNAGWTVSWGYIPSYIIFIIFIGYGTIQINRILNFLISDFFFRGFIKQAFNITAVWSIMLLANENMSWRFKQDHSSEYFSKQILSELPSDSILFCEYTWFPLIYMQEVERRRPDLTFLLQGEVFFPELFETISETRFPNIKAYNISNNNNNATLNLFWRFFNINDNDHPLFWEPDSQFQNLLLDYLTPKGLIFSLTPEKKKIIEKGSIRKYYEYLNKLYNNELSFSLHNDEGRNLISNKLNYLANYWIKLSNVNEASKAFSIAARIWPDGEKLHNNYGAYLMSRGELSKSLEHLKQSYEISPYQMSVYKNMANVMLRIEQYDTAFTILKDAERLSKKRDESFYVMLGVAHAEARDCNAAIRSLKQSSYLIRNKVSKNSSPKDYKEKLKLINLYKEFCLEAMINKS